MDNSEYEALKTEIEGLHKRVSELEAEVNAQNSQMHSMMNDERSCRANQMYSMMNDFAARIEEVGVNRK